MAESKAHSRWTSLRCGDVIRLSRRGVDSFQGFIVDRTEDGLVIRVRDELGDGRLFHAHDDYDLSPSENVHSY